MIPVLTAADVKRQDAAASERGVAVDTLMHAAGTAVAHAAIDLLGGAYGARVVVACGKGNNGGDDPRSVRSAEEVDRRMRDGGPGGAHQRVDGDPTSGCSGVLALDVCCGEDGDHPARLTRR